MEIWCKPGGSAPQNARKGQGLSGTCTLRIAMMHMWCSVYRGSGNLQTHLHPAMSDSQHRLLQSISLVLGSIIHSGMKLSRPCGPPRIRDVHSKLIPAQRGV